MHSDVVGPIEPTSRCGSRFYVVFMDDETRMLFGYAMKQDEVSATIKIY